MHIIVYQDAGRKWKYQVNFTMGIIICMDFFRSDKDPPNPEIEMTRYILPVRPNRADRRKVEIKKTVYFTYRVA